MDEINKMLSRLTNPEEVANMSCKNINLIKYDELKQYRNFNELFIKNNYILLYIPMKNNVGHWIALYRNELLNTIYIFNSYGKKPDDDLLYSEFYIFPDLSKLIIYDPYDYNFEYFNYPFQKFNKEIIIATCGRWCAIFLKYFDSINDVDEFINIFKKAEIILKKDIKNCNYGLDILCCFMTEKYLY